MKCYLMHKNIEVALLEVDDNAYWAVLKIYEVYNLAHAPIISIRKDTIDRGLLNIWWKNRFIPEERDKLQGILTALNKYSRNDLISNCLGLSLSDHYWLNPVDQYLNWDNINFFTNSFSMDFGDVAFSLYEDKIQHIDLNTPDLTTEGWLKKRWSIIDNKRYLIKEGSLPFYQEPFNEVIASKLMSELDIPHVTYDLIWINEEPYSICENFLSPSLELITAWQIMSCFKKSNNINTYTHLMNCCNELGIPNIQGFLEQQIIVDFIILNEDRHFNNFGFIRNADTLEWLGPAPIYDTGSSLLYNKASTTQLSKVKAKPWRQTHKEQLQLVKDFTHFNWSNLIGFTVEVEEFLTPLDKYQGMGVCRSKLLANTMQRQIDYLQSL